MTFKEHLHTVERRISLEDKSKYTYVLSQNERNYRLPKKLWNKFLKTVNQEDFFFYPDTRILKTKLANHHKISEKEIFITPGSDIGIKTVFEILNLTDKKVLTTSPCFPMYSVYSNLYNVSIEYVKYTSPVLNFSDIISSIDSNTGLVILANPNSPMGDYLTEEQIRQLLDTGVPLLLDEAYIELSYLQSYTPLCFEYTNLFILKTFSKGLGAAGCRVGYIISQKQNVDILNKHRFMYEISGMSLKYALFILDNFKYFKKTNLKLLKEKQKLVEYLSFNYTIVDTKSSWFFIQTTPKLKTLLDKHRVLYRELVIPGKNENWIKFNYDLKIKKSKLEKELIENGGK